MAEKIRIRGRKEWGGVYEGEALVSKAPIMGWCNCDIRHGYTSEHAHPLFKVPMKGKVLVFDTQRGSGGFTMYGTASLLGTGPAAYVHTAKCALTVSNAQMARVPSMTDFEIDPTTVIETGDWVLVNADEGYIEVTKKEK